MLSTELNRAWKLASTGSIVERGVSSMRGSGRLLGLDTENMRKIL